ncbi:BglG family transcription antiterminator [Staphylococcus sp. SQ8-PEA]|uniref:BglG family transcription antiterminator n=1 Tax=Staphylococcus marylandisciuri TaxID=2981529 RepID=A0ABT2QRK2_9STAP|nr:BglG family transcription antiterminator [Staphylococcus marylandisciuri]MCU5746616.1 BglG family transcription antiterminator [Staphylococcus marylandisciuri]
MLLSKREKDILKIFLTYNHQFITIYDIAQSLAVSSRTIHRELKHLEHTLAPLGIELKRVTRKGIKLNASEFAIKQLETLISEQQPSELSNEEQKVIILYALIQATDPIKQYSLAHEIGVSTQALSKLLDELERDLNTYELTLQRKRGLGLILSGPESKKRELLSSWMVNNLSSTSVYSVIENHFVYQSLTQTQLNMVDIDKIFKIERILMDYLEPLPYTLMEASYINLTIHIVLSVDRMQKGNYVALNESMYSQVKDTKEFSVAKDIAKHLETTYKVKFNKAELTFITIHLRGAKRKETTEDSDRELQHINSLIELVGKYTEQRFTEVHSLVEGLRLHLVPAMNRLEANIETFNPLTDMIKNKYHRLFTSVRKAVRQLWPDFHFPDSEIAFIVLHFGGSIRQQENNKLNILVVCSSGIGTSRLLSTRLQQAFPLIINTVQSSVGDLSQLDLNQYDAIISTVNLDINQPYLTVNPLLPQPDIKQVAQFLNIDTATQTSAIANQPKLELEAPLVETALDKIKSGLLLIENSYIEHVDIADWIEHLTNALTNKAMIQDRESFVEVLKGRQMERGYTLDPYPLALPHLKHKMIKQPVMIISILQTPIKLSPHNGVPIKYIISIFIPDDDALAHIISELTSELFIYLEDLDSMMKQPEKLLNILKQKYLLMLKQTLDSE